MDRVKNIGSTIGNGVVEIFKKYWWILLIALIVICIILLTVFLILKFRPKPCATDAQISVLKNFPTVFTCKEKLLSFGSYQVDVVDPNNKSIGYVIRNTDPNPLATVHKYQYYDISNGKVAIINASEKSDLGALLKLDFTNSTNLTPCPNTINLNNYTISSTIEQQLLSNAFGKIYTQYNIKKNGQDFAVSEKVDMFNSDVTIKDLNGNVIATMFKPAVDLSSWSSFLNNAINITYSIKVDNPAVIEPWCVAFIASLIIIHLRMIKNQKSSKK